jgi:hypothetical protein
MVVNRNIGRKLTNLQQVWQTWSHIKDFLLSCLGVEQQRNLINGKIYSKFTLRVPIQDVGAIVVYKFWKGPNEHVIFWVLVLIFYSVGAFIFFFISPDFCFYICIVIIVLFSKFVFYLQYQWHVWQINCLCLSVVFCNLIKVDYSQH